MGLCHSYVPSATLYQTDLMYVPPIRRCMFALICRVFRSRGVPLACFTSRRPGFRPMPGHKGFTLHLISFENLGFSSQFSFHQQLHIH
jgi:hypothetical protein